MKTARLFRCWMVPLLALVISIPTQANEDDDGESTDASLNTMVRLAESVEIRAGDQRQVLTLQPPVQRWSNPIAVQIPDAALFVWTKGQRPAAAAQLFRIGDGPWLQEHQSLSRQRLVGSHDGRVFWSTTSDGIEWQRPSMSVSRPADSEKTRLFQMRSIARAYTAEHTPHSNVPTRLRLLTTPVYQYTQPEEGVVDGALFSFAAGTDPEVLMLIEAWHDPEQEGPSEWRIAFAPMTIFVCRVLRGDETVWSCTYRPPPQTRSSTFILLEH